MTGSRGLIAADSSIAASPTARSAGSSDIVPSRPVRGRMRVAPIVRHDGEAMRAQSRGPARVITTIELPAEALTVIAAPPDLISQRNVEAVTGIPARVYLDELRAPGFPVAVIKVGKLRLVEREAFLSYLRTRACRPPRSPGEAAPDGVAAVLAEIGLEPAPKRGNGQTSSLPQAGSRGKIPRQK